MKYVLLISFVAHTMEVLHCQPQYDELNPIVKIKVFAVSRDQKGIVGVNPINIKSIKNVAVFEIVDTVCLKTIQKNLLELKELQITHEMRTIYLLCEIFYKDGLRKSIAFEASPSGCIQVNSKIFLYDAGLESKILGCSIKQ